MFRINWHGYFGRYYNKTIFLIAAVALNPTFGLATPVGKHENLAKEIEKILNAPKPRGSADVIAKNLGAFRGKPSQHAFKRLGYPDRKMIVDGAIVYSWINNDTNIDGSALVCTIKVVVRAAKILSTDFYGNNGACVRFAQKLDLTFTGRY